MFWNLTLQPGQTYSTTVHESFHLSMAALDVSTAKNDNEIYPVLLTIDGEETVLCNLNKSQFLQVNLDHMFEKGSKVKFLTTGKAVIHLTGYVVEGDFDSSDYSEEDSTSSLDEALDKEGLKSSKIESQKKNKRKTEPIEEVAKKKAKPKLGADDEKGVDMSMHTLNHKKSLDTSDTDEDDDDDDDDDDYEDTDEDSDSEDIAGRKEESKPKGQKTPQKTPKKKPDEKTPNHLNDIAGRKEESKPKGQKTPQQTPKKKPETPQQTPKKKPDEKTPNQNKNNLQKQTPAGSNKKQNKQQNQSLTNHATPKSETKGNKGTPQQKQGGGSPQKRTLAGGVHVEDLKTGNGPVAKPGKMVAVYYTGRLKTNNRVFDQTQKGPGFKFRLGKGEVIKGWDVGVAGMTVGSKRRITCPAAMAYGGKGSPPEIPPNATLVFDVELKGVHN